MRWIVAVAALAVLSACVYPLGRYVRAEGPSKPASAVVSKTRAEILDTAAKILAMDGFQITAIDRATGIVSTAPREMALTPEQVDCGKIDFPVMEPAIALLEYHAVTRVAYNVFADDNHLEVRTTISGTPGLKSDAKHRSSLPATLGCVSRGVLERGVLNEIVGQHVEVAH